MKARYPTDGGEVQVAFASIRDTFTGRTFGPGWVLFARGTCLRNSEGGAGLDARGDDPNNSVCTGFPTVPVPHPVTAEPLVAVTGFDESGTFGPDLAG